jgi:uracil-DNA glycosylase family 4
MAQSIALVNKRIISCRQCPRLVKWREEIAEIKVRRFMNETYWGKPVPGFGDPDAQLLIVGLAPAAHGANRTGRMFTGDESGHWLFRALFKAGFASQPSSVSKNDGLVLKNCYITAVCRCAPPLNKPLPAEIRNCRPFMIGELNVLKQLRVIVGLGKVGFDGAFDCIKHLGRTSLKSRPRFSHGAVVPLNDTLTLIGSYHPSRQNTFTGVLTLSRFNAIFTKTNRILQRNHLK